MRPYGNQEQLEKRRRRAMGLLKEGMNVSAVAKKIGCSHSSVILWREQLRRGGLDALKSKPVPGRPHKLEKRQRHSLVRVLLKGPMNCGYSTDLWTTRRVAKVIRKRFGVQYHANHIWRLLVGLGWSCQKPEKRARERDEEAIQHWKRYKWPHIKKSSTTWCPSGFPR